MVLTAGVALGAIAAWLVLAVRQMLRLGLGFRQAFLYAPLKLAYRIDDRPMRRARDAAAPVIYLVSHESNLDPALMLSLLPQDTLHILDSFSAKSSWIEPWRELARTIAFNAEHVFVSRRLVRVLKRRGRLAVYLPGDVEPDLKTFRLYRAVARIAQKSDARIVPIHIGGARHLPFSLTPAADAPRRLLPKLSIAALEPMTVAELVARSAPAASAANALFDHVSEARLASAGVDRTLFKAMRDSADRYGSSQVAVEDVVTGALTYRRLFTGARLIGARLADLSAPGEPVGVMLPNANGLVLTVLGLLSAGRPAAMINYTAGPANVKAAIRTALVRTVVSSRAFVDKAGIADIVAAAELGGARMVWLEDLRDGMTALGKLAAALLWRRPLASVRADVPAVILFTSGTEGTPKAVVLSHRNLLANVRQAQVRIRLSPRDKLLNVLPGFHSFGLTAGILLPLAAGVRLFLYPSPLHYKLVPEVARKSKPTILLGTDTFLTGYARAAGDEDFASVRLIVAGAEAVKPDTRRAWRERFGAEIVEGFGLTEAAPVVAVNSATHNREGTVGRVMAGTRYRLEPVEGIAEGGRLWLSGPNVMLGYMTADRPGVLQPVKDWHDSGDIVTIDREGFIAIKGRAKRFAKIAGEMVSLGAVEMLVSALWPEDRHAVVSVPDKRRGERLVLVTTAANADANALRQHGKKAGAAELMVPGDIVKVSEMPLLGSGKTDYGAARKIAMTGLGIDTAA